MSSEPDPILHVAMTIPRTEAEGPGVRFAVWVQGCPMRCAGCCNPEMLSFTPREAVSALRASALVGQCLATDAEGVSFLGGEPFAQADGLAAVARGVRAAGRSVMVFSGYTLDELRAMDAPGVAELLAHTDLLVDGRYEASQRTTTRRWVGSDNQVMHFLTDRYTPLDPRFHEGNHLEIRLRRGEITLNGWPAHGRNTRLGPAR
jgi:anaerobic ribonucleoside-triphosphate reductase activating protein